MAKFILAFLFSMLFLQNVRSESLSFSFPNFGGPEEPNLAFLGDARPSGAVLQLTRRDDEPSGAILKPHSVGRVVHISPVHLWDNSTGNLADFSTEFSFVVDTRRHVIDHGDGLSFFIIPYDANPRIPTNSSGGYLGLFAPQTAFDTNQNQIVAVEFDTFRNEWDPQLPLPRAPHVGLDVNSLASVETTSWPIDFLREGSIGRAVVAYNSKRKELRVLVGYDSTEPHTIIGFTHTIDLRTVLPEYVRIGFSAATGDEVETHDILSWSFHADI